MVFVCGIVIMPLPGGAPSQHLLIITSNLWGRWGGRQGTFPCSFTSPFSFRLDKTAFEDLGDVQASILLLQHILNGFQVLFRIKQLFKNIT